MSLEEHFPPPSIRNVRVELGGREIGMSEHLLNASEVGSSLQQVGGEGVPEEMRVDPLRLEARLRGEPPQDQERPSAGERASDRKSTRLNSSHQIISYAVFCLQKKKTPI